MTDEQQQELVQLVKDFQELLKSDNEGDYVHSWHEYYSASFNDKFNEKRKDLLRRVDEFFAPEDERWKYYE